MFMEFDNKRIYYILPNVRAMQDSIKKIIKKFREHDPFHYTHNKQNHYKRQPQTKEMSQSIDDAQLAKKVSTLEKTIDNLVTDANRAIKYYQQLLREHAFSTEQLKEEYFNYKLGVIEESKDSQAEIKELNQCIQKLQNEISKKDNQYVALLQRYQDFEESVQQMRKEDEQNLIQMQEKIRTETFLFQEKITNSEVQSGETQSKLAQLIARNEDLENENDFLKKIVEELMQENQDLKEKFLEEDQQLNLQQLQQKSKCEESRSFVEYDFDCKSREEQPIKQEDTKMEDSREFYLQNSKEILNISEHYSKHNRTEEIISKDNSNRRFIILNSSESKLENITQRRKNLKHNQPVCRLFSNGMMRINTGDSDKSMHRYQPQNQSNINEVKEFRMIEHNQNHPTINPYKAFFQLMTQCEKMNSPYFWMVCNVELNDLYEKFVREGVPYNLWQAEIRKALYQKVN